MIGHLGTRVSALLDGRLPPEEEERAWEHVHACHPCRDLVEREGWVKTRLACLNYDSATAPSALKHALLMGAPAGVSPMHDHVSHPVGHGRTRHLAALGGGALGAAVVGMLALGAGPANAPQPDRRAPVTSLVTPTPTATPTTLRQGLGGRVAPVVGGAPVRLGVVREKMSP